MAAKTREEAWALLTEFTQSPQLLKHALGVEVAMRAYARKFGEDEELWGVVGLIHDFDYERYPTAEDHPFRGMAILRERGWPEEMVGAVGSHADYAGIPRDTLLKQTLFAVDELTGLVAAVALVRPSKDIRDVKVKSVKNKWKDGAFARGVNRGDVEEGAALLGLDLWEHVGTVLEAMQGAAAELELDGRLAQGASGA
ncbi:MAG: HDIG domain-containing protein [Chloroflexi bacterium]|nr:HDIG domain-containing protein [Chloroflexota bacterium]